jgi:hypothetical protein
MTTVTVREVWSGCPRCFADVHTGPCALVAHLPGKHNQKDHAGRKGTPAEAEPLSGAAALDAAPYNLSTAGGTDVLPDVQVQQAISRYGNHGYRQINAHLRGEDVFSGPLAGQYRAESDELVGRIDKAMAVSKLRDSVLVHRGVPSAEGTFGPSAAGRTRFEGMTWKDNAFVSTSADRDIANHFAGEVIMQVRVPRGTQAITLSGAKRESEILLDRGLTFKVTGQTDVILDDGRVQRHLDVDVLG